MKTKYNNHFSMEDNRTEQHNSYIQMYLLEEISCLLAPSARQVTRADLKDIYIHNRDMEKVLERYKKHTSSNNTCIIEGLTGSGKSMLVQYAFEIRGLTCKTMERNLIIPLNFDGTLYSRVEELFSNMVRGACNCLIKKFPQLHHIDDFPEDFYDYIEHNRQDLLPCDQYPTPLVLDQLKIILERNSLGFYSSALKFYLSQTDVCTIDNVILVVDDIEGIRVADEDRQDIIHELLPIKMALEFIECMQNPGNGLVPWSLNTVICCRHYVSRLMRTLPFSLEETTNYIQKISAYSVCERYDLQDSPKLIEIIQKRYDALLKVESGATDRWTTAMRVVMQLITQVDNRMLDFILNSTLGNIREAFNKVKQIVLNRRWIQRDFVPQSPGAFSIYDLNQYDVKPASLIRAFCMNESAVYNSKESIIPNLLYNDPNYDMELIVLLALKHFLLIANNKAMSWDAHISIADFKKSISHLFCSENYDDCFASAICYLIEHRLLLRSYDQEQRDTTGLTRQVIEQVENVYLPRLAIDLWNRMNSTSVFFEMFIDDIWLSNDPRTYPKQQFRGFDTENYELCLQHMFTLAKSEHVIYARAKNMHIGNITFEEVFGSESVCAHLIGGLESSLYAYYRKPDDHEAKVVGKWKKDIKQLRNLCSKIYSNRPI